MKPSGFYVDPFYPTKIAKKEGHGKYFRPFLISRSIKSLLGIPPIYYRCYDKITALSFSKNASAFHLKRLYVLGKTHLRLKENVLAFCDERKDVFLCLFSGLEKPCFQTFSAPMMSRTELYP